MLAMTFSKPLMMRASQSLPSMVSCRPPWGMTTEVLLRLLATGTPPLLETRSRVVERRTPLAAMVALPRPGMPRARPAKSSAWLPWWEEGWVERVVERVGGAVSGVAAIHEKGEGTGEGGGVCACVRVCVRQRGGGRAR